MSFIINAHSIFMVLLLCPFHKKKLWVMFAKAKNVAKSSQWMNAWRNSIFDLIFYALYFTLKSFGLRKKNSLHIPLLVVFSSFPLMTLLELLKLKVVLFILHLFWDPKPLFFCFMAREENLWFQIAIRRELHNEAYG